MSLLSRAGISVAVAQVRTVDAGLNAIVQGLVSTGDWEGPDADRFEREWRDLVSARLRSAASRLETIDLNPFN